MMLVLSITNPGQNGQTVERMMHVWKLGIWNVLKVQRNHYNRAKDTKTVITCERDDAVIQTVQVCIGSNYRCTQVN